MLLREEESLDTRRSVPQWGRPAQNELRVKRKWKRAPTRSKCMDMLRQPRRMGMCRESSTGNRRSNKQEGNGRLWKSRPKKCRKRVWQPYVVAYVTKVPHSLGIWTLGPGWVECLASVVLLQELCHLLAGSGVSKASSYSQSSRSASRLREDMSSQYPVPRCPMFPHHSRLLPSGTVGPCKLFCNLLGPVAFYHSNRNVN